MDLDEYDDEADPVALVVGVALAWSEDGRLDRAVLRQIIDEFGVPGRLYRELDVALQTAGLVVCDSDGTSPEDSGEDDAPGVCGFETFRRRAAHPILTADEEIALAQRIERGRIAECLLEVGEDLGIDHRVVLEWWVLDGLRAAEQFVLHNLRLVIHYARRFSRRLGRLTLDDLVQEGYFGLVRAVEKFDPSKGYKFSTYATWWLRQSMQRAIANAARTIRVPVHYHDQILQLRRVEQAILEAGGEPSTDAIAAAMGISPTKVAEIRHVAADPASLDAWTWDGGSPVADALVDRVVPLVEEIVEDRIAAELVAGMLSAELDERERTVIMRRFGIGDGTPRTLEEIGQDFGVTRERIRQIESKALDKLKS
ncbi:MAG: sigma-70 family RNA polymerase sigma factor, partial [Acidimicrobiales bacterium]|nr:sigma-70 family RNA polymerase sigma factor [Acidimicrobiales bacterium]